MQAALETNSVCLPMTMKKRRGFLLSRNPLREGKNSKSVFNSQAQPWRFSRALLYSLFGREGADRAHGSTKLALESKVGKEFERPNF